jgi:hypothetical protein
MPESAKPNFMERKITGAQLLCPAKATGYQYPALDRDRSGAEVVIGIDPLNGEVGRGSVTRGPGPSVTGPFGTVTVTVADHGAQIAVEPADPGFGPSYKLTIDTYSAATAPAKGSAGSKGEPLANQIAQKARACLKP